MALEVVPGPRHRHRDSAAVIAARLSIPQPRQPLVTRKRLFDRMTHGVRGSLTVVHGPAGYGKTLLVATWAASGHRPGPVAWVTLDSDADAPGPFWAYVLDALRGCGLQAAREDIGVPARAETIDRSYLARVAAAVSELGGPVVLVLDDYDQVSPGPVDGELEFVLRNSAPHLRLVVIGRRQPPLRLARYRVAGDLTEIGPADLAFTGEETGELLRQHGVPLPAEVVDDITTQTEGWVTGLRLSALALQHGTSPGELRHLVAAGQGDTAEFLLAEVVDEQPPETQDLLLRTCLLERVNGDIADALTGRSDGQQTLHGLALSGTFVRALPGSAGWYRYHELFARALRGRLAHRHPDLVPELHRRASHWLADHGWLTEAVAHAVAVEDWSLAADVVVDRLAVGHLLVGLDAHRLTTLFAGLPADITTAEVALVRAALAMSRFDAAACVAALDSAAATVSEVAPARRDAVRLGISAVGVIVSRLTGDLGAGEAAGAEARALMAKMPPDRLTEHPELPALVLSSLGTLQLWGGSLDAAQQSLQDGLSVAAGPATEYSRSNCLGQLALIHYVRGRLRMAHGSAMEALQMVERAGLSTATRVPVGHLAAAAIAWEWNDLQAVRMHVEHAAASMAARHDPSIAVLVAQLRARYRMAHGDFAHAVQILDAAAEDRARLPAASFVHASFVVDEALARLADGDPDGAVSGLQQLPPASPDRAVGLARVRLATGQPREALSTLEEVEDEPGMAPSLAIRAQLATAQALLATERPGDARRGVERALRLAREEGFRRPFAESGPWLKQVLARDRGLASAHRWLGAELTGEAQGPGGREEPPTLVAQPLTDRELEILRLVAQPMSSREVAETLHLSPNTVKTHLSSVYRKLAAPTRNQAVRRARTLGIL
jgi:LuxR family maltose regulon positive regulatory protein